MTDYPSPVNQLLAVGDPRKMGDDWPNYLNYGLSPEHIPDLIRLATDSELNRGDPESKEVWAPLHAWRALGQLRAEAAVVPLLTLFRDDDDDYDEWANEELPEVFGMIGPAAIPALAAYLDDTSHGTYTRCYVANGLVKIAEKHPESRSECVAIITRQLEQAEQNDPSLNGFFVANLLDLKAVESAPVIERAFAADAVDESIAGDWPYVQYELGLTDQPPPRRRFQPPMPGLFPVLPPSSDQRPKSAKAKAKARRKQAAKSRKRNRKHKRK